MDYMDSGTVFIFLIISLSIYDRYKLQVKCPKREEVPIKIIKF